MTYRKGNSRVVVYSDPENWGKWYDSVLFPGITVPLGAGNIEPPANVPVEEAWKKVTEGLGIGTLLKSINLAHPLVAPQYEKVPQ